MSGSAHVTNGGSDGYDVNCRAGVALPPDFPSQVPGGESNVTFVKRKYAN